MHVNPQLIYCLTGAGFLALAIFLQIKGGLLNDVSTAHDKPFSYARVQLAWWTFIILTLLLSIFLATGEIADLRDSTLILLGLGALTTGGARMVDIADKQRTSAAASATSPNDLSINKESEGFMLDILSDNNGINMHRLQTVVFNACIGLWFIRQSFIAMHCVSTAWGQADINNVIPDLSQNTLILLGLSAGTYVALKTTENK